MPKILLPLFFFALLLFSCKDKETTPAKSSDATLKTITLGAENFNITVPEAGVSTALKNAPRTIQSVITAVPVNLTVADHAAISKGGAAFTSGTAVDFTNPVTFIVTAQDGTAKNYTVAITVYDASANPYGVYTVKHLSDVRNALDKSYKLMNNISLPAANAEGVAATGISDYAEAGWLPIANDVTIDYDKDELKGGFTGTFDGGGNTIDNFYMNRTGLFNGFFSATQATATIKNLNIKGIANAAALTAKNDGGDSCYAGILVGLNYGGTISDCSSAGDVSFTGSAKKFGVGGLVGVDSEGKIQNCYATGNVSSSSTFVRASGAAKTYVQSEGGLIGKSLKSDISKCYATGNVLGQSASDFYVGGFIGDIDDCSVSNCFATGMASVTHVGNELYIAAGGLFGFVFSSGTCRISNCYTSGNVLLSGTETGLYAGGLVGMIYYKPGDNPPQISNCYRNSSADIKKNNADATPTDATRNNITVKTKVEMQSDTFKNSLNGTGSIWGRNDGRNDKLPYIVGVGK